MSTRMKLDFLQERIRDARSRVRTGLICTVAGFIFIGIGEVINIAGGYLPPSLNVAIILFVLGGFLVLMGVPLLIVSFQRYRNLKRELKDLNDGSQVAQKSPKVLARPN